MSSFFRYKISLAYQGTKYCGWQRQRHHLSIQEAVEKVFTTLLKTPISLVGASRTDSGVHAFEQVAHFDIHQQLPLDLNRLIYSANCLLPRDIRLLSFTPASPLFHACYSAKKKIYRYYFGIGPILSPFSSCFRYCPFFPCDISLLKEASSYFLGTHDFTTFSNESDRGAAGRNPIRTIYTIQIVKREISSSCLFSDIMNPLFFDSNEKEEMYCLQIEGNGFLYKMVRNIMGVLFEVGRGKIQPSEILPLFNMKDRSAAPAPAPPQGLFLFKIFYEG